MLMKPRIENGFFDCGETIQTHDRLVKLRTALKNKVNNLFSARGIELEKEELSGKKGLTVLRDRTAHAPLQ
jgi:hypothetical protein